MYVSQSDQASVSSALSSFLLFSLHRISPLVFSSCVFPSDFLSHNVLSALLSHQQCVEQRVECGVEWCGVVRSSVCGEVCMEWSGVVWSGVVCLW